MAEINFGPKRMLAQKKIFAPQKCLIQQNSPQKTFFVQKIFAPQKIWGQKMGGPENFVQNLRTTKIKVPKNF